LSDDRRCLVIDGQPTLRLGVRDLLGDRYEVSEAEAGEDALEMVRMIEDFDVAIVDLRRTDADRDSLSGTATIRALRKACPALGIVAHGPRAERQTATEALRAGATAYVAKSSSPDALNRAVDAAADSERFVDPATENGKRKSAALTKRQREILQLLADGHNTRRIAKRLGLSAETIRTHTKAVLARLDARDRTHAVAIALRNSLID
jgi:two-component system NarL family response regulator